MNFPTAAELSRFPARPLPEGCRCACPSAEGCQALKINLARYWERTEPKGPRCRCRCHTNGSWSR